MRVEASVDQNDYECAKIVEMAVKHFVYQYDDTEVENEEKRILRECERLGKGGKYAKCLDFKKDFEIPNAREAASLEDFCEIGQYVKNIYLHDIALMRLVIDKKLMPVRMRYNSEIELNIKHSQGNMVLKVQMDLSPFDVYVVI